jgi:hypothetical protein
MAVYKKQRIKIEFCFLCPSATDTFVLYCCEQYETHIKLYCMYVLSLICRLRLNMVCCSFPSSCMSRRSCTSVCFGGESNIMNFETGKWFSTLFSFYAFNTELLRSVAQLAGISHLHVFVLCEIIWLQLLFLLDYN